MRMKKENKDCLIIAILGKAKDIVMVVVLGGFMGVLFLLFMIVGMGWSLADYVVRKLEKGRYL